MPLPYFYDDISVNCKTNPALSTLSNQPHTLLTGRRVFGEANANQVRIFISPINYPSPCIQIYFA